MTRAHPRAWAAARALAGAAILAVVLARLGTGPFLDGVRRVDVASLAAAAAIALPATVCCAWRWRLVAGGLGVDLPLRTAVAAYYRSQFLNTVLPGGVLGDVQRAVRHGRDVGDVGLGLRAAAWERSAGQVVQVVMAVMVLLALPSPARGWIPAAAAVIGAGLLGAVLLSRVGPGRGGSIGARTARAAAADLRGGLLARRVWPGVVATSALAVAGHAATFLVAARAAGTTAPVAVVLPLATVALLAMAVPTAVGGWGPREGVTAWAFAAAGLGAGRGLATAVVYGVLVFVATAPGAVLLVVDALRSRVAPGPVGPPPRARRHRPSTVGGALPGPVARG